MDNKISTDIYIESLKRAVEAKSGIVPEYPSDFDALYLHINKECRDVLSTTTLKRIWGYIEEWRVPRIATLDILARYVGHNDFRAFVSVCDAQNNVQSAYTDARTLCVHMLAIGAEVELRWHPGRRVLLRYKGDFSFEVLLNEASKLIEGSEVRFTMLCEGHPLYADVTLPGGGPSRPYMAGADTGIIFKQL